MVSAMAKKHPGFSEEYQSPLKGHLNFHEVPLENLGDRLKIGPGGRVVVPVDMREALGVEEGDTLIARVTDGELRLMSPKSAIRRAQARVLAGIPVASRGNVVDEFIAERRREALREEAEMDQHKDLQNGQLPGGARQR